MVAVNVECELFTSAAGRLWWRERGEHGDSKPNVVEKNSLPNCTVRAGGALGTGGAEGAGTGTGAGGEEEEKSLFKVDAVNEEDPGGGGK